jgi:cell division protein ZapA
MRHAVEVEIAGQRFQIRTDADAEHVRRLAAYVETRIRTLEARGASPQSHRLALLAALNLTEELFREREARARLRTRTRAATRTILAELARLSPKPGR